MDAKQLIKPGYYDATLTDWKLDFIGQNQTPAVVLYLAISTDDGVETLNYKGFLTEKAKARTVADLVMLGLTDTDLVRFAQGKEANALTAGKHVRVKVAHETYNGKIYERIKGIYEPRSQSQRNFDAIARAGNIKIAGEVRAAKAEVKSVQPKAVTTGGADDLPF